MYGQEYADYIRDWVIERRQENEYGISAKRLKDNNVPLDKTCLEYIGRDLLQLEGK